ncbi:MAG: hypothetical protein AAF668_13970 [Pseudomonadota bacterium]
MITVRPKTVRSHLCPIEGPRLAAYEGRRLERWLAACRYRGEDVMFLTLTYDPAPYGGVNHPDCIESIWEAAKRNKHLSRCMTRLGEALGRSLKGMWRAKAEFQPRSGLLHFHVLLRGFPFIDFRILRDAWGHGVVKPLRAQRKHARYIAKYAAKSGKMSFPDFLLDQSARSVKLWHTSPGFWDILHDVEDVAVSEKKCRLGSTRRDYYRCHSRIVEGINPRSNLPRDGETLRERLQRPVGVVVSDQDNGTLHVEGVDAGTLVLVLVHQFGHRHVSKRYGGDYIDATINDAKMAARMAALLLAKLEDDRRESKDFAFFQYLDSVGGCSCSAQYFASMGPRMRTHDAGGCEPPLDLITRQVRVSGSSALTCRDAWPDDIAPF